MTTMLNHPVKQINRGMSNCLPVNGKMTTLNFDTNTPHPRGNYRIQGTKGVYWADRYFDPKNQKFI
jgi:hypothetical protein